MVGGGQLLGGITPDKTIETKTIIFVYNNIM